MIGKLTQVIQFFWMFENQYHQRLAWKDARKARLARDRAEAQAAAQLLAMQTANPSGALGDAVVNDPHNIERSGLL